MSRPPRLKTHAPTTDLTLYLLHPLTAIRDRQVAQQAEARAERAVELAQERVVPAYERL